MATGLWTSVSGATAQSQMVDSVANNLANADTLGFKKDAPTFKEYLSSVEREDSHTTQGLQGPEATRAPIKNRDLLPGETRDLSFVVVDGTYTNFRPGNLRVTQSPLDVAIDGKGFFEVSTPNGIRYTRQGSFKVATDGRLVTTEGYPVLATQAGGLGTALTTVSVGPDQGRAIATQGGVAAEAGVAARFINLRDRSGPVTINQQGDLYAGENLLGRISVVEFRDIQKLRKAGGLLFENRDIENVETAQEQADEAVPVKSILRQGVLETSNVNPIEEMTNLIRANRLFEHDLKAMKTYGEILGREANDIGKL